MAHLPAGRDRAAFVRAQTRLGPVPFVPEIRIFQAREPVGLWELTEGEFRSDQPPPFWAFPWGGGQGLARYLLDHREHVAGRRVLDLASGSGLVAIAAARAGAARVHAVDVDPTAIAAIRLNAGANRVRVRTVLGDILDREIPHREHPRNRSDGASRPAHHGASRPAYHGASGQAAEDASGGLAAIDAVLAGDVFYSKVMAERVFGFLRRAVRAGVDVLVGDPERAFLPRAYFDPLRTYEVPVSEALESAATMRTTIWRLRPPRPTSRDVTLGP